MAASNSNAFPPLENSMNSPSRSPTSSPASQVNGNGGAHASSYMPPLPVGHQQDLAFLYQQIQELSSILQSNRERVNDVTRSAEEVAVNMPLNVPVLVLIFLQRRANLSNGHSNEDPPVDRELLSNMLCSH